MAQLTIRLDDRLALELKQHASAGGRSLNSWVTAVLRAAVDPDLATSETERIRARLARAGLLAEPQDTPQAARPVEGRVRQARAAAGAGTQLSEIVSEGRG